VLHVLKRVIVHLSARAVKGADEGLEAVEVTWANWAVGIASTRNKVEALEDVIGSHSLGELEAKFELSLVGLLSLNNRVKVVELDVSGADSRHVSLGINWGLEANGFLSLVEESLEEISL